MQGPALRFLIAANDLHLIHLHHLFPGVAAIRHAGHVALVRVDHLTKVAWANWHLEGEALCKHAVRFNQARAVYALSISVALAVEGLFEQDETAFLDPRLGKLLAGVLAPLNVFEPVLELLLGDFLLHSLISAGLTEQNAQGHYTPDEVEMCRVTILFPVLFAEAELSRHGC